jgi:hypothetical protein
MGWRLPLQLHLFEPWRIYTNDGTGRYSIDIVYMRKNHTSGRICAFNEITRRWLRFQSLIGIADQGQSTGKAPTV